MGFRVWSDAERIGQERDLLFRSGIRPVRHVRYFCERSEVRIRFDSGTPRTHQLIADAVIAVFALAPRDTTGNADKERGWIIGADRPL